MDYMTWKDIPYSTTVDMIISFHFSGPWLEQAYKMLMLMGFRDSILEWKRKYEIFGQIEA